MAAQPQPTPARALQQQRTATAVVLAIAAVTAKSAVTFNTCNSPEVWEANLMRLGALLLLAFLLPPDPATKYALAIVCATSNKLPLDNFACNKDQFKSQLIIAAESI